MAKVLKVKALSISTEEDFAILEEFLSSVGSIEQVIHFSGKVLVIYEEE